MSTCSPAQMLPTLFPPEPTFSRLTWAFSSQVQKEFQVIVEDRNDNAPVFQNTDFSTNISEVASALMGCVFGGSSQQGVQDWEEYLLEGVAAGTKSRACNPMNNRHSNIWQVIGLDWNSFNCKKKKKELLFLRI